MKNVTISFDGIRKNTYEKIRRGSNYELTIKRILSFRESLREKNTFFAINSVLMRSNFKEIIETINFWNLNNFDQLRLIFMVMRSLDKDLLQESLYPMRKHVFEKLDEAAEHIISNNLKITISSPDFNQSSLKNLYPDNVIENVVRSNNPNSKTYFNPRHYYQNGKHSGMKVACRSPFTFARILANGDVQLCLRYKIGNLNKRNFEDIWYGKKAQQVRKNVMSDPKICYNCDYFRFCLNSNKININDKINYFDQSLIKKASFINFNDVF